MTLLDMARNFTKAVAGWAGAGFPMVSEKEFQKRAEICAACPHWNDAARHGMGSCDLCGCSRAKLFMATQRCPIGKWEAEETKTDATTAMLKRCRKGIKNAEKKD